MRPRRGPPEGRDPAAPAPFSRPWLRAFGPLVEGAPIRGLPAVRRCAQLVCTDGDRVRPWVIEVVDGRVACVRHSLCSDAEVVIAHSVNVGWRLLGLSVRGFHRLDELVVEQLVARRWSRHPMPPLDEGMIDLTPGDDDTVVWHERVIDSPLGTLFVRRGLVDGRIKLVGASTKPPPATGGVGSDVSWRDVMALRRPGTDADAIARRAWRGADHEVGAVHRALIRSPAAAGMPRVRVHRDRALLETLAVIRSLRAALRGSPAWRELWRPSARPPPP